MTWLKYKLILVLHSYIDEIDKRLDEKRQIKTKLSHVVDTAVLKVYMIQLCEHQIKHLVCLISKSKESNLIASLFLPSMIGWLFIV